MWYKGFLLSFDDTFLTRHNVSDACKQFLWETVQLCGVEMLSVTRLMRDIITVHQKSHQHSEVGLS